MLFVHGWPVSSATFRRLLPHLVDHVTCHLIDFPSAGSSRFDADTAMSIEQDPFFPVGKAKAMVGTFPDSTFEVIEGAGLFSHEERPAEVAQALLPTLTGGR